MGLRPWGLWRGMWVKVHLGGLNQGRGWEIQWVRKLIGRRRLVEMGLYRMELGRGGSLLEEGLESLLAEQAILREQLALALGLVQALERVLVQALGQVLEQVRELQPVLAPVSVQERVWVRVSVRVLPLVPGQVPVLEQVLAQALALVLRRKMAHKPLLA